MLLSPPRNRGLGRNLDASPSTQQHPRPHGNPVLRELVAMDTLPRVPACQPPSHGAAPGVCSHTRESWGREQWARRQLGPCCQACPGRGAGPPRPSLHRGAARALSLAWPSGPGLWQGPSAPLPSPSPEAGPGGLSGARKPARSALTPSSASRRCASPAHSSPFLSLDPLGAETEVTVRREPRLLPWRQ